MAGSSSRELRSAYVAEVTPGTTPATPAFKTLAVPAMVMATPKTVTSKTLQAGGAVQGQAVAGIEVSGSMAGPLIYGSYDDILETLLQGAWATNVLKNAKLQKTVTVENAIPAGVGGTNTMMRFRGVQALAGTITAAANEEVGFSFDLRGMGSDAATTTAITGATYTDPTGLIPLASGVDVGTIAFDGYTLDCMSRVEVSFAHEGREDQYKLGTNDLCGITRGALIPTITARVFVEDDFLAIYNAVRANHATFSVTIPLGSVSGSKYTMLFPKCAFASADLDFGSDTAMQTVVIQPQYNSATSCVVQITRAVA